jgi:hypothetical protein
MKTFCKMVILLLGMFVLGGEVKAQDIVKYQIPISTHINDARFEFVSSTKFSVQAFLQDKYSGKVWRKTGRGTLQQVSVEGLVAVEADKVNFQLYMDNTNDCFLLNIHTGELWQYRIDKLTNWVFKKLEMPAELK